MYICGRCLAFWQNVCATELRGLSEVLEMMDEVGQFASFVDFVAGGHNAFGERPGSAREHSDFGYLIMK